MTPSISSTHRQGTEFDLARQLPNERPAELGRSDPDASRAYRLDGAEGPKLSVIVPVLNEESDLPALLADLASLTVPHEIIVIDGGSADGTVARARAAGTRVLTTSPGRGGQLRLGASEARAPLLCFLHADVRLGPAALRALESLAGRPPSRAVAFRLSIRASGLTYRIIELGTNLRSRWLGLPFGDQGLIVTRSSYEAAGGYPDVPLMEDVALALSLRRKPGLHLLRECVEASPRRWQSEGPFRRSLRNYRLLLRFLRGADPAVLAREYPPLSATTERS